MNVRTFGAGKKMKAVKALQALLSSRGTHIYLLKKYI